MLYGARFALEYSCLSETKQWTGVEDRAGEAASLMQIGRVKSTKKKKNCDKTSRSTQYDAWVKSLSRHFLQPLIHIFF